MSHKKQRYATDPEYRESRKARDRAYKRANSARINAQRRQRYARNPKLTAIANLKTRLRLYGLSHADYEAMSSRQNGACALCGRKPGGTLCVDHCHVTGRPRHLLCRKCNIGLGNFNEDPVLVRAAADYLEVWRMTHEIRKPRRSLPREAGTGGGYPRGVNPKACSKRLA
jgi:hypothetical protein